MLRRASRLLAGIVVLGTIAPALSLAGDRTADEILKEYRALKAPSPAAIRVMKAGPERDKAIAAYRADIVSYNQKQAELVGELAKVDPDNAELTTLLPQRWIALVQGGKVDEAKKDVDAALAKLKDGKLKTEALFIKAQIGFMKEDDPAGTMAAVEEFVKANPSDQRSGMLLYGAAMNSEGDKKTAFEDRLLKDFPQSPYVGQVKSARKMRALVGKPFELEFTDAIKDTTVSIKGLKGKVVVVDFWATWCGPCVQEMPKMKKLYAEFKDKGVEFIGVSLDQPKDKGGLDALKAFVKENDIQWPQYYQGNYWQSEFSSGLGINSIPCVFVVDQDGNVYSVEGRGKLETMIPELLKKKGGAAGAGGQ